MLPSNTRSNIVFLSLSATIATILVTVGLMNLTPPISRDALIHHLAIPKLWLEHGGFYEMPWAVYSYYPMNIDLLYLVSLYFNNDIAPKFIHFSFAIATGVLVYLYLNRRLGRNWGLLGMLIFLSTPIIIRLSCSAYVDLGLVFFTSASVFAFVKWREVNYEKVVWLALSAIFMGLASGTKYNALIGWLFLNLMIVFFYSKSTKKPLGAIKYGAIFFAITFIIASPWFIKNYILTSNPIYPLFDDLFNPSKQEGGPRGIIGTGIFYTRATLYGEQFWEILLIPFRMFFQGEDNSDQFFDGRLSPILVLTIPLAFLGKNYRSENLFFLFFSLFLIFVTLFRAVPRVRYIAPVIPLLTVLSVMGMKELVNRCQSMKDYFGKPVLVVLFVCSTVLIVYNVLYLAAYFVSVGPIPFIVNRETRQDFLTRHMASFPAIHYINKNLPSDSKVFLVFLGRRGYYLERAYFHESGYGMRTLRHLVTSSNDEKTFVSRVRSLKCTHMLIRIDLLNKFLHDNYGDDAIARFLAFSERFWEPVYDANGYVVFDLFPKPMASKEPQFHNLTEL